MKTTLSVYNEVFFTQFDMLHAAQENFVYRNINEMSKFCTAIACNIVNITNPRETLWFLQHRKETLKIKITPPPCGGSHPTQPDLSDGGFPPEGGIKYFLILGGERVDRMPIKSIIGETEGHNTGHDTFQKPGELT